MSKGSVGLGLATRRMSAATCQDRKTGKAAMFFLCLSALILISNIFAGNAVDSLRHAAVDRTAGVTSVVMAPVAVLGDKIDSLRMMMDVKRYNAQLAEENQRLLEWFQAANRLQSENAALRELLNMKDEEALEFHSGLVIGDTDTHYAQTILVRLGTDDGIDKGQGVLTHEGLIGRVIETGRNTARILLLSDVNSRIPVTVEGSRNKAIMAGRNGGDPVLDHLPEDHGVASGQRVVTSGHGGVFPFGIPVGETYITDTNEIAVRPYADPNRASHVQVVNYGVPAGSARRSVADAGGGILR